MEEIMDIAHITSEPKKVSFYAKKIHSNPEFYEAEKKRATEYQRIKYQTDEEYKIKRREYCRQRMNEMNKRKREIKKTLEELEANQQQQQ